MPGLPAFDVDLKSWQPPPQASAVPCQDWKWLDFATASWKHADAIHLGEMRAANLWLETAARVPRLRHQRGVILSDSSAVVGAGTKGRSPSFAFNRDLRRRMALEVVSGFPTSLRWVSTKVMPADKLSRDRRLQGPILGIRRKVIRCLKKQKVRG